MMDDITDEINPGYVEVLRDSDLSQKGGGISNRIKALIQRFITNTRLAIIFFDTIIVSMILVGIVFLFVFLIYIIPVLQEMQTGENITITTAPDLKKDTGYRKQIGQMNRDIQRLSRKYSSYTSGLSYLVINTTDNQFYLYLNKKIIRQGFCSSGSYKMLKTETGRSWIFKTPKGKFWIQGKTTHPSWRRPDWSFVEEGLPVPSQNDPSRYEYGVLGDYAMALGDGYLIHGTLYTRFLGMPVTHGCVRLNDEDLEAVFKTLSIGSKVYIF